MPIKDLRERYPAKESQGPDVENLPRRDLFGRVAGWTTRFTGGRWGFLFAFGSVLVWAALGPFCGYSNNWQLVINTGTGAIRHVPDGLP